MRGQAAVAIVLEDAGIEIPYGISDVGSFRRWARSDSFPERGRIDWVAGKMEVDLAREDVNAHGSPKAAIASVLLRLVHDPGRGLVFIGRMRLSSTSADLSAEPDVLVLLTRTVERGRVKLVPKASGEAGRYVEIEGAADIVVECVSDSSAVKDLRALRAAYHAAGVREYWIVDARGMEPRLELLHHRRDGYVPARPDGGGFVRSGVLRKRVRLVRVRQRAGLVFYRLDVA